MFIYADGVKLAIRVRSDEDSRLFQSILDDFAHWAREMGLSLSRHKCSVLHFWVHSRIYRYTLDGVEFETSPHMRDLGVMFSDRLDFRLMSDVGKRASLTSSWILRSLSLVSSTAYTLYLSYCIVSHIVSILTSPLPVAQLLPTLS